MHATNKTYMSIMYVVFGRNILVTILTFMSHNRLH